MMTTSFVLKFKKLGFPAKLKKTIDENDEFEFKLKNEHNHLIDRRDVDVSNAKEKHRTNVHEKLSLKLKLQ